MRKIFKLEDISVILESVTVKCSTLVIWVGLERLYDFVLSYNPVPNLKPLESLPSLETLVVYLDHEVKHVIFDQVDILINMGVDVEYNR